ncbi:MAG: glycosyltransferase [Solirubrobacteraceae bacterium]
MADDPLVTVVFATHNRADRLPALLRSLRAQTLGTTRFEVVVVDNGSTDDTPGVLLREMESGGLALRVLRHNEPRGPARARNAGWRAGQGGLFAFTDDDCVASPDWLAAGVAAWEGDPERIVQGRTDPDPAEMDRMGPYGRTLRIHDLGPYYQTCNVFYPRALLERADGFDAEAFPGLSAEDADLAWRCLETGATSRFAPEAQVFHAVHELGPAGRLRIAWRPHEAVQVFARHPEWRSTLTYGLFWKGTHYLLARAALGLLLPRRRGLGPLRFWCLAPIVPSYLRRGPDEGGSLRHGPYFLLHDVVETAAVIRGAVRYRTLVI